MNSRVLRESDLRDASTLVISGDDEDRDALVGHACEWLECLPGDARWRTRAIEHVPAMNDEIDLAVEGRAERGRVVRQKVVPAATSLDARPRRQIEAEVGVGEEEDADAFGHGGKIDAISSTDVSLSEPISPSGRRLVARVVTDRLIQSSLNLASVCPMDR